MNKFNYFIKYDDFAGYLTCFLNNENIFQISAKNLPVRSLLFFKALRDSCVKLYISAVPYCYTCICHSWRLTLTIYIDKGSSWSNVLK